MAHTTQLQAGQDAKKQPTPGFLRLSPSGVAVDASISERLPQVEPSPCMRSKIAQAKAHFGSLGAERVFAHSIAVLRAAAEGKLLDPKADESDMLSMRLAEQILYHSFVSDSYLPAGATFSRRFFETFDIQRKLHDLDSIPGDRSAEYIKLLNDPSTDVTDLLVALYTRMADMMTVHDPETLAAASTVKMPGVFHVRQDWGLTTAAMADPMMKIYCPIADWGGQTYAYRSMRDNAMLYNHPRYFQEVSQDARKYSKALEQTNRFMMGVLQELAKELGVSLVVAKDYRAVSQALPEVTDNTMAVALKPFKGVGGLLYKMLQKGIPIEQVHDWTGLTVITSSVTRMYDAVSFIYNKGIRLVAGSRGVSDLPLCEPVDYAANPKQVTNYQSVHVDSVGTGQELLPAEFIIRTVDMHIAADEGAASHDRYKRSPLVNGERKRFMQRLSEIKQAA